MSLIKESRGAGTDVDAAGGPLEVTVRSGDDRDVVALAGELDGAAAPQLASAVRELLAGGRRNFVVDLDAVTFLDTSGVRALIIATEVVSRTGGSLWVTHNARCVRLLKITNQMYRLNITDTRATQPIRPSVRGGGAPRADC